MKYFIFICAIFFSLNSISKEIRVRSTDDSGPGTLREAVEFFFNDGDTIIIDVKGEIILESSILFDGLTNLVLIGPSPKHSSIKATSAFIGTSVIEITNCSNLLFFQLGFAGSANNSVNILNISNNSGAININRCLFKDIDYTGAGAAISTYDSQLQIHNCSFITNSASLGGAIMISLADVLIENCTFWNNEALNEGGAIYSDNNSTVSLIQNTFFQNSAGGNGTAFYSADISNSIYLKNNAIGENGVIIDQQFFGPGTFISNGGNCYKMNLPLENIQWTAEGNDFSNTGLNLGFRSAILEDGFGMWYFPIIDASSNLIDIGSTGVGIPDKDTRGAPRILDANNDAIYLPDAGACEYTPLRVIINSGAPAPGSLSWALAPGQNTNPVNFIEFDLLIDLTIIEPVTDLVLEGNYIIDGFSQNGSAVPGPDLEGGTGVTPGLFPIIINNGTSNTNCGIQVNNSSNASVILGLRIINFEKHGILILGTNTRVEGCEIGIDPMSNVLPNLESGIRIDGNTNIIGGQFSWQRNVISGNAPSGTQANIYLNAGSNQNKILGNIIGISNTGLFSVNGFNPLYGILDFGDSTIIGMPRVGNIISGHALDDACGIKLNAGSGQIIQGNIIGLNFAGSLPISNSNGIHISNSGNVLIGGNFISGQGNIISGNTENGILIDSTSNTISVKGNKIGTDAYGNDVVTEGNGIALNNTSNNVIGGIEAGEENEIANCKTGISVGQFAVATSIQILGNIIHDNNYLGIDLDGDEEVLINDGIENDGNNGEIDFPEIISFFGCTGATQIVFVVNVEIGPAYTVEFYSNSNPDETNGEAEQFLGRVVISPSEISDTLIFDFGYHINNGTSITSTITGPNGTSEFGENFLVAYFSAPTIVATDSIFCPLEPFAELVVNTSDSTSAIWSLDSSTSAPVSNLPYFTPTSLEIGDNYIFVKLITNSGCESLYDSINYYLSDVSDMTAAPDIESCSGYLVQLGATGGLSYFWTPNQNLNDAGIADPVVIVTGNETYVVQITNVFDCVVFDSVNVFLLPLTDCDFEMSNAFSPNDDGVNDFWIIDGIEAFQYNQVTIFNRWGDPLIKLDNYDNDEIVWDGKTENGEAIPNGTYFYIVNVEGSQSQSGWLQVVY